MLLIPLLALFFLYWYCALFCLACDQQI